MAELSFTPPPEKLPANTMPVPDPAAAQRHSVTLTGGMTGGMDMGSRGMDGMMGNGGYMKPILTLTRGKSYILTIEDQTAWHHPIHLHGQYSFRVIASNLIGSASIIMKECRRSADGSMSIALLAAATVTTKPRSST